MKPRTKTIHLPSGRIAHLPIARPPLTTKPSRLRGAPKRPHFSADVSSVAYMQVVQDVDRHDAIRKLLDESGQLPARSFQWGELDSKGDLVPQEGQS